MPVSAVYSSSSVTELSDVSDAGSGMVITDAERASVIYMTNLLESNGIKKLSTLLNPANGEPINLDLIKNVVLISTDDGPQLYENDLVTLFDTVTVTGNMNSLSNPVTGSITDMVTGEELVTFNLLVDEATFTVQTRLGLVNLITIGDDKYVLFKSVFVADTPLALDSTSTSLAEAARVAPADGSDPTYQSIKLLYEAAAQGIPA